MAGLASADAERNGEMGLAGPRRAEKYDVLVSGDEVERAEMGNHGALHGVLVVEIKVLERLVAGEARGSNAVVTAVSLACRHLPFQTR